MIAGTNPLNIIFDLCCMFSVSELADTQKIVTILYNTTEYTQLNTYNN